MAQVISQKELERHNVNKYNFKVLSLGQKALNKRLNEELHQDQEEFEKNNFEQEKEEPKPQQESTPQKTQKNSSSKDSIIESLLKKVDEMSSNFIKLQMKLEAMQEEHKQELKKVEEEAYQRGVEEGKKFALNEMEEKYNQTLELFANSISKLEQKANEYNTALESLKKELVNAAVDIATEVVDVELSENSNEIAYKLATSLIDDLKEASKITLKVSPKNLTYLSEKFSKLQNVEIVADSAINDGGVIAISDIENIDAQIPKRFQRVKKVVLSE